MKIHTIRSERTQVRQNGTYATYPLYSHLTGLQIGTIETYATDLSAYLKRAEQQPDATKQPPFYMWTDKEIETFNTIKA
jgi:hypothetical protein